MEKTVKDFANLLEKMIEGGRPYWKALADHIDSEMLNIEEAIEWLSDIESGKEI